MAGGVLWLLQLPEILALTQRNNMAGRTLSDVKLRFRVSLSGVPLAVTLCMPTEDHELGAPAWSEFFLTLARQRERDARAGLADDEQGWVERAQEETRHGLKPNQLNRWTSRLRERLKGAGVTDPERLLERRDHNQEIRLGVTCVVER